MHQWIRKDKLKGMNRKYKRTYRKGNENSALGLFQKIRPSQYLHDIGTVYLRLKFIECLRHSLKNNTALSQNYTIVNYRPLKVMIKQSHDEINPPLMPYCTVHLR